MAILVQQQATNRVHQPLDALAPWIFPDIAAQAENPGGEISRLPPALRADQLQCIIIQNVTVHNFNGRPLLQTSGQYHWL